MSSGIGDDSPAPQAPASPRLIPRIIQWRNWSLVVKLVAVMLVPVIFALALGVLQIRNQVQQADEYSKLDRIVAASGSIRSAAAELQEERIRAVEFLKNGPVSADTLRERFAATDKALAENALVDSVSATHVHSSTPQAVQAAAEEIAKQRSALDGLRQQIRASSLDSGVAIDSYNRAVNALLALDRALIDEISSTELGSIAARLHELSRISQEMRLQQTWVLLGLLRSDFTSALVAELEASETRRVATVMEFRTAATPQQRAEYDRLYLNPAFSDRENTLRLAMASGSENNDNSAQSFAMPANVWQDQSRSALFELSALQERLEHQQHSTAYTLEENASNLAGVESVILLSALLIASAVVIVFARQLIGSLDTLRNSALETANSQLPKALAQVRAGKGSRVTIGRVPVHTTEEVGQVARAFDDVQKQAISLAAEQARLRKSYGDSFVNVSRRSQSLLERQLRLFEQLERDEEDPDQLATLFQLDHLATRMRRNNENLMVLSGSDLSKRFSQATSPADLIRAAVSEIEHYPRVIVQALPNVRIVGYAASDLVRLLAELLDNAANFSAPQTSVTVCGERRGDGTMKIDIIDSGIGMSEVELTAANKRLTAYGDWELSTSRRMGLFVVGRLANRHNIQVTFHKDADRNGIRVTIGLRAELIQDHSGLSVARTNGVALDQHADPLTQPGFEDTLVEKLDWNAIEPEPPKSPIPTRNGFHLPGLSPPRLNGTNGNHPHGHQGHGHQGREHQGEHRRGPSRTHPKHKLFTPVEHDQHTTTASPPTNGASNPTPIFDNLASAWFQDSQPAHPEYGPDAADVRWPTRDERPTSSLTERNPPCVNPNSRPESEPSPRTDECWQSPSSWKFTSDAQLRDNDVSAPESSEYTSVGLPIRVPRTNLVADSVSNNGSTACPGTRRDANAARRRMSSFQQGVWQGRHRESAAQDATPKDTTLPPEDNARTQWAFDADDAAQQAEAALNREPEGYTSAGLPRRTPKAQLAPGAATDPITPEGAPRRDAGLMRGRLADFQRGVREGKHSLREPRDNETRKTDPGTADPGTEQKTAEPTHQRGGQETV